MQTREARPPPRLSIEKIIFSVLDGPASFVAKRLEERRKHADILLCYSQASSGCSPINKHFEAQSHGFTTYCLRIICLGS